MELLKEDSDYLRHPLMEELVSATSNINEDAAQLMKFHGSYQQDDREQRGAGKVCSSCLWFVLFCMAGVLHGGVCISGSVTGFFCLCCVLCFVRNRLVCRVVWVIYIRVAVGRSSLDCSCKPATLLGCRIRSAGA